MICNITETGCKYYTQDCGDNIITRHQRIRTELSIKGFNCVWCNNYTKNIDSAICTRCMEGVRMNNTKKLAGFHELSNMRNGGLKAYEKCYRRYAVKDCVDDMYEWGAMVQCRYICEHIMNIPSELLDMVERKIDSELKVTADADK